VVPQQLLLLTRVQYLDGAADWRCVVDDSDDVADDTPAGMQQAG
jgi:hypothetical protein